MDMMSLRRRVLVNQNKLMTATGNPITFNTPLTKPLKECVVRFTPTQEGSGTPSPDNVRNISGRSSVKLWQSGKNIFGGWQVASLLGYTESNIHEDENGRYVSIGTKNEVSFPEGIFKENTQYTFIVKSYTDYSSNMKTFRIHYTDGTVTDVSSPSRVGTVAVTTSASKIIRGISIINRSATRYFYFEESGFFEGVCTVDDFEPYKGLNEITFTFPSTVGDNGVVYGGYLDTEKGELVAEYQLFDCADHLTTASNIEMVNGNLCRIRGSKFIDTGTLSDGIAERFETFSGSWSQMTTATGEKIMASGYVGFSSSNFGYTTKDEWLEYLTQNHIKFCAKLSEPIHYSLTPQSIATLRGSNVMWSDGDELTVKYWTR